MPQQHVHRIIDPSLYTAPSDAITAERNGNKYVMTSESKLEGAEMLAEFRPQEFDQTVDLNKYIKKSVVGTTMMGYGCLLLVGGGILYGRSKKRSS